VLPDELDLRRRLAAVEIKLEAWSTKDSEISLRIFDTQKKSLALLESHGPRLTTLETRTTAVEARLRSQLIKTAVYELVRH
jgi:hypothetical protein